MMGIVGDIANPHTTSLGSPLNLTIVVMFLKSVPHFNEKYHKELQHEIIVHIKVQFNYIERHQILCSANLRALDVDTLNYRIIDLYIEATFTRGIRNGSIWNRSL